MLFERDSPVFRVPYYLGYAPGPSARAIVAEIEQDLKEHHPEVRVESRMREGVNVLFIDTKRTGGQKFAVSVYPVSEIDARFKLNELAQRLGRGLSN